MLHVAQLHTLPGKLTELVPGLTGCQDQGYKVSTEVSAVTNLTRHMQDQHAKVCAIDNHIRQGGLHVRVKDAGSQLPGVLCRCGTISVRNRQGVIL